MKPISIVWSEGVSEADAKETISAMREFLRFLQGVALEQNIGLAPILLRPYGNWVLNDKAGWDAYHSFRWYWESSLDQETGQVSAATLFEIVRYEPWQHAEPHLVLALLHTDLCNDTQESNGACPSVFACTEPQLITAISVRHLGHIADRELRLKCLRSLVMHNFGHLVGLPERLPPADLSAHAPGTASGDRARPCDAKCTMYEAQSIDDLMSVAAAADPGLALCRKCRHELRSVVFSLHFSVN